MIPTARCGSQAGLLELGSAQVMPAALHEHLLYAGHCAKHFSSSHAYDILAREVLSTFNE